MSCWSKKLRQDWSLTTYAEIANASTPTTLNKCQSKQTLCVEYLQLFIKRIKHIVNTVMNYLVTIFIFTQNVLLETAKSVQTQSLKCAGMACSILDFVNVATPHMQKVNANPVICTNIENQRGVKYER
jgi:hypothetical protein